MPTEASLWTVLMQYAATNPFVGGATGFLALALIFAGLMKVFRPDLQTARADRITSATIENQISELKAVRDRLSAVEKAFDDFKERTLAQRQEYGETILNLRSELTTVRRELAEVRAQYEKATAEKQAMAEELAQTKAELHLYELQSGAQAQKIEQLEKEVATLKAKSSGPAYGRRKDDETPPGAR